MQRILFVFLLAFAYASAEYITTYECPNVTTHSRNILMEVSDCSASDERCPLYQGRTHAVVFLFETTKNYTGKVDFRVYGVFEKFTVPYKGKSDAYEKAIYTDNQQSLKDVGMFIANRQVKHTSDFAVSENYPKVQLKVKFVVQEKKTKEIIMCAQIPVGIESPPTA